jgi:hypothetical protein
MFTGFKAVPGFGVCVRQLPPATQFPKRSTGSIDICSTDAGHGALTPYLCYQNMIYSFDTNVALCDAV